MRVKNLQPYLRDFSLVVLFPPPVMKKRPLSLLSIKQKLMRDLETKEKELNKLKSKTDALLKANHPASDKIEVNSSPDLLKRLEPTRFLTQEALVFLHRPTGTPCRHSGVGCCRSPSALTPTSRRTQLTARYYDQTGTHWGNKEPLD